MSRTLPTTTPRTSSPTRWMCSTSKPSRTSVAPTSSALAVSSGSSARSHETGTRTSGLHAERGGEPLVALVEVTDVGHAVPEHQRPLEPHPEREPAVPLGIDTARDEHRRVDHAAATPLDPAFGRADATGPATWLGRRAAALEALQVELGGRLGEGEVRRPQPGPHPLAEHRSGEVVERAAQVRHRDALVDAQPLDLAEHRRMRRVECVGAE